MRVLLVSNTYPPDLSGVASLVQEMARQLDRDHEHEVVVLTRELPDRQHPEPFLETVAGGKSAFLLKSGIRYLRLAREKPFDLVHVHESDGGGVAFVHWLFRLFRRPAGRAPLVATLQVSYREERRQVRSVYLVDAGSSEPVSEPTPKERSSARLALVHVAFGWLIARLADLVVAPSHVTKAELERDYGAKNVRVVYNGIDVDAIPHARSRPTSSGPVEILYAGRMRTRKAVAVLLHAFRRVLDRGLDARLVLVGGGEQRDALFEDGQDLFRDRPERVRFVGQLSRDETLRCYADADIYCLPSLYEGFPLAILEAMAAGLPVVTTDVSGNREALEKNPEIGESGLLVPPRDAGALADALAELIRDPALRRAMGEAGRRRVATEFDIEKIVGDYLRLWDDLRRSTPSS